MEIKKTKLTDERKKAMLRLTIALAIIIIVSVGIYLILKHVGATDTNKIKEFVESTGAWSIVVLLSIQIVATTFLSFVPAISMIFTLVSVALFGPTGKAFLVCFTGLVLSSILMDIIGRFGGSKIIEKMVGKKDYEEAQNLVQEKGLVYVPIMYMLPLFPDNAICMVVGATKLKFWIHLIYIVLFRGIGTATIVFGFGILPHDLIDNLKAFNWSFIYEHIFDYIEMITIIVFWAIVVFYLARKVDKFLTKKMNAKREALKASEEVKEETNIEIKNEEIKEQS
ncbi:MAG: VTT domain-containing protein [Gammaproteobacteria bacterium]|nr:VTT domain-containing protein [Gammaproteobacteria bacterium]